MTALITLTVAGIETGPFDLYSNLNGFSSPFAVNISKSSLQSGYTTSSVPDYTSIVRVKSKGICVNYTDIVLAPYVPTTTSSTTSTPTTTTTSSTSTTTSSTTVAPTTTTTSTSGGPTTTTTSTSGVGTTTTSTTVAPTTTTSTTAAPTTTTSTTVAPTTTTTTIPPTTTTTSTTAAPEVPCNETVESGGMGITERYVTLLPAGGLIVFALNAYGVPDKLEIIHNGVKKATTGMANPNEGPFDDIYGSPTIPTQPQTLPISQFIGDDKTEPIPNRQATFNSETGSSLTIPPGFQQLVWWEYTPADYTVNSLAIIRVTGTEGTIWDLQRVCEIPGSTTTTTSTIAPGFLSMAYSGTNTIRSIVTSDFTTARTTADVTANTNFSVACFRNLGNYVVQRFYCGFNTTGITSATSGGIRINLSGNTLANSTSFALVRTTVNHPATHAWNMADFTDSNGGVLHTNTISIPAGYTGIVNFPFNATGLSYINSNNDCTFVLVQFPNDYSDVAPSETATQNISGANSGVELYYS